MLTKLSNGKSATILLTSFTVFINTSVLTGCSSQNAEIINYDAAEIEKKNSLSITTSKSFVLPSGNIYCALVGVKQDSLRCEIQSMLNPLPPQPNNCEFDWGAGFLLSQQSKPEILCISDTIGDSNYQLDYETLWRNSGFECKSQRIGLTCKNSNDQGFFISREKWNIFE